MLVGSSKYTPKSMTGRSRVLDEGMINFHEGEWAGHAEFNLFQ